MDFRYPRDRRITCKKEFDAVFSRGRKIAGRFLLAFVVDGSSNSRLGTVVSRKWGNAVRRNRIKRLMRESFRLLSPDFPSPVEIVLLPRYIPLQVRLSDIMGDLAAIIKRYPESGLSR